jgi:hypothetical protein
VLTDDQAKALEAIRAFMGDKGSTSFLLLGNAGTGKTFALAEVLKANTGIRCCVTPTHKSVQVLRRKLQALGVPICYGYDRNTFDQRTVLTGTTAALLGIRPFVVDDQTEDEVQFKKLSDGLLSKVKPTLLIIDEASMLSLRDLTHLLKTAKATGMKVLLSGDAGQLPPVKEVKIPFEKFQNKAVLNEIVRQERDSAIIKVASAVREGKPWQGITGPGVEHTRDLVRCFLDRIKPSTGAEETRSVYIGYRNKKVDFVQEAACQKLYKHGRQEIWAGELVLSDMNFYADVMDVNDRGYAITVKELQCANQDDLIVEEFHDEKPDPTLGIRTTMRHLGRGDKFEACYLPGNALADSKHPYNVELDKRLTRAKELQAKFKLLNAQKKHSEAEGLNAERREAWNNYFKWKGQTILKIRHPFAMTSHRSQGSTYSTAYVDVADILRFSSQGLYVATSRPKDLLVLENRSAPAMVYEIDENDPMFL